MNLFSKGLYGSSKLILVAGLLIAMVSFGASEQYTFDTCGNDGRYGPNSGDCSYSGDNQVDIVGDGIQEWNVPSSGVYEITAYGAAAGGDSSYTGYGAEISGEFELEEDQTLKILVGQMGRPHGGYDGTVAAGGGGGTFVTEADNNILVIAGGGGTAYGSSYSYSDGQTSEDGADGDGGSGGSGGSDGAGGGSDVSGDGGAGYSGGGSGSAQSFLDGGVGGNSNDPEGGFGGGGSGWSCCHNNEFGGGGGYSGGGGAESGSWNNLGAGGGGSKNNGDNQDNSAGVNYGHGYVEIELLTNPDNPIIQDPIVTDKGHGGSGDPPWMDIEVNVDIDYDDGDASDNELEYCEIEVTGQDNGGTITRSNSNPSGDECDFEVENDDHSNWQSGEEVSISASVEDSYEGTDTLTRVAEFPFPVPEIVDVSSQEYNDEHAFNLTVDAEFDRDNFEDLLEIEMENQDSTEEEAVFDETEDNKWKEEDGRDVEYTIKVEPENCLSNNCQGDYAFDVEDTIDSHINLTDEGVASDTTNFNNQIIPNSPPQINLVSPEDGEFILEEDVELRVEITDAESDPIEEVIFRDSDTNDVLESYSNEGEGYYDVEWGPLSVGEYSWEVETSDVYETIEMTSSFERVVSNIYRVQKEIDHPYSALIVDKDSSAILFLETSIDTDDRTVTTYISGEDIETEFQDNGEDEKTYDISVGNTERHQIMVEGVETGITELEIVTEDDTVDVNTTETFPVYVQDPVAEGQQVPGLTTGYLALIAVFSSLAYFALL